MIRVKVCGLTRLRDALLAEKLGADFLGFIFYRRSLRHISPAGCRPIIEKLDPATRTAGVFVNEPIDKIMRIANRLKLDFVQLHGSETNRMIVALSRAGLKTIKAVPVDEKGGIISRTDFKSDLLLFDSKTDCGFGGTGVTFDPGIVKTIRRPFFLSGGLNAGNIKAACEIARPYGVDISSGVESKPGVKSPRKLKELFKVMDDINGKS
jgi:phosphoribosylanthranilate isomerase